MRDGTGSTKTKGGIVSGDLGPGRSSQDAPPSEPSNLRLLLSRFALVG